MPWRIKTLTEFKPSSASSCSREVFGQDSDEAGLDELLGDDLNDVGFEDWELAGDFSQSCEPAVEPCSVGALELGATQIPRGPVLDDGNFSQMVTNAFICGREPLKIQMPWEKGVSKTIFSKKLGTVAPLPVQAKHWVSAELPCTGSEALRSEKMVDDPREVLVGALHEKVLSAISDKQFHEKKEDLLHAAVDKWFSIIRVNLLGSAVGREIIGHGNLYEQKETIEAIIGVRSRSTAVSRANALLKFFRWRASETEDDGKPVTEKDAWDYLCHLRQSGAAATAASSFLSSCRYAMHIFGFADFEAVCNSRRLSGMAELLHSGKAPIKQAKVLSVLQVLQLHSMLDDSSMNHVDRALIGYIVVALYSRCRHSDLAHVHSVVLDYDDEGGFVEIRTSCHKTARSASQKSQFLPILAPAVGVHGREWVSSVISAFEGVGLNFGGRVDGPLFKPPNGEKGGPANRGLASSEVTKLLRLLFEVTEPELGEPRVSSHSLKATMLSWCSKAGLPVYDKAILGRHSSSYNEAQAVYSRDLAIGSVMKLQDIIWQIHSNVFMPDNTRRGYFAETSSVQLAGDASELIKVEESDSEPLPLEGAEAAGVALEEEASVSSEDSGSDAESDSEGEVLQRPAKCYRHFAKGPLTGKFVIHKTSRLVHYKDSLLVPNDNEKARALSCGKALNDNYEIVEEFETVAMCRRCKVNATKDNLLPQT